MDEELKLAQKGFTAHKWLEYVKENRVEMLVVSLLLYSVGALDKAITYGTGICV